MPSDVKRPARSTPTAESRAIVAVAEAFNAIAASIPRQPPCAIERDRRLLGDQGDRRFESAVKPVESNQLDLRIEQADLARRDPAAELASSGDVVRKPSWTVLTSAIIAR